MEKQILRATTIKLRVPGIELESKIVWGILGDVAEQFPELNQYGGDENTQTYQIKSENEKGEEQTLVTIGKEAIVIASRQEMTSGEWTKKSFEILDLILSKIIISPLSVMHLDNQLMYIYNTDVHHGNALFSLFGTAPSLQNMFSDMRIIQFVPAGLSFVDPDEDIVCRLSFSSNVPNKAERMEVYPDKYTLVAECGIAKIGNFNPRSSLREVAGKIFRLSEPIFANNFIPNIDVPITTYIEEHS